MTKRGKVQLKRIEDRTSRQVRFSKRRSGLFKKAFELAVLCDVEVALVVFSPAGKLYEFSTSSIESTFNRYKQTMLVNEGTDYLQINCEDASTSTEFLNRSDFLQWFSSRNIDQMDVRELDEFGATLTETLREIKSRMTTLEGRTEGSKQGTSNR